jgi:hypothetical protein
MLQDVLQIVYFGLGALSLAVFVIVHGLMNRAMSNVGDYDQLSFGASWIMCLPFGVVGAYFLWLALFS